MGLLKSGDHLIKNIPARPEAKKEKKMNVRKRFV
jgi:hypothetical protein